MSLSVRTGRWTAVVSSLLWAAICGCGGNRPAPSGQSPTGAPAVDAGQSVQVIARDGDFAQVRTADGQTGFVPASHLQSPPGSSESGAAEQVLTTATSLTPEKPVATETEQPRALADIMREREQLNALYVSGDGKTTKLRPRGAGPFMDSASGQPFWLAFTCSNPACQKKGEPGKPFVFPLVPGKYNVTPEGNIVADGPSPRFQCPSCSGDAVRLYVPPETEQRRKELDAEHQQLNKQRRQSSPAGAAG